MCGKNNSTTACKLGMIGSPPRVREKRPNPVHKIRDVWDHPRVCGKNVAPVNIAVALAGSPPRVREKLHVQLVLK